MLAGTVWHHPSYPELLYPVHDINPNVLSPSKLDGEGAKVPQLATAPDHGNGRERAKHIDIRKHLAHEVIQNGQMLLVKVPTTGQTGQMAGILTKGLRFPQVLACVDGLLHQLSTTST